MATTRGNVLRRASLVLAGVLGVGAGAKATRLIDVDTSSLVLYARPVPGPQPAVLPTRGERQTLVAELLERPDGTAVGELYGAGFTVHGPSAATAAGVERLELHTFRLPEGTIVGSGMHGQEDGVFAVLGGTGRFAGARGSYTTSPLDPSPGATTELRFTLTP
jgi:hypothetical protein